MLNILQTKKGFSIITPTFKEVGLCESFKEAKLKVKSLSENRLFIKIINSGSTGNCSIIKYNDDIIIIDLGITLKELQVELIKLKLDLEDITGVYITHDHGDHLNVKTKKHLRDLGIPFNIFSDEGSILNRLKFINITSYNNNHDDVISLGFFIKINTFTFCWNTDLSSCDSIPLKEYDLIILECNYDEKGLNEAVGSGKYPQSLANRIRASHLSKEQGIKWLDKYNYNDTPIMYVHLSKNALSDKPVEKVFYSKKIK